MMNKAEATMLIQKLLDADSELAEGLDGVHKEIFEEVRDRRDTSDEDGGAS